MLALGQKRTKSFSFSAACFFRFHPSFLEKTQLKVVSGQKRMKQKTSSNTNETKKKTGTDEKTTKPKKKTG